MEKQLRFGPWGFTSLPVSVTTTVVSEHIFGNFITLLSFSRRFCKNYLQLRKTPMGNVGFTNFPKNIWTNTIYISDLTHIRKYVHVGRYSNFTEFKSIPYMICSSLWDSSRANCTSYQVRNDWDHIFMSYLNHHDWGILWTTVILRVISE